MLDRIAHCTGQAHPCVYINPFMHVVRVMTHAVGVVIRATRNCQVSEPAGRTQTEIWSVKIRIKI